MKFIATALLLCLTTPFAMAQDGNRHNTGHYSPGGLLDTVCDYLGHRYSLQQIAIDNNVRSGAGGVYNKTTVSTCSSGYFQLYLEPGCGLDGSDAASVARLNVVCQVLNDLSSFINSPLSTSATGQKINIWVRNPTAVGWLPPAFAGVAGSFYNEPVSATASGIGDNAVWVTLNSGKDAFKNIVSPLYTAGGTYSYGATFFHGWMAFQCDGSIPWHTNLTTPTASGEIDLYTVALHEMLHSLGFASLIEYNGASRLGSHYKYYSRYDKYLQTHTGVPLLSGGASGCGMYNWSFNSTLTPASAVSPGSTAATCPSGYQTGAYVNHTVCTNSVNFADGSMTQPVYTPACYEQGSSLSHFEDECVVPAGFAISTPASNDHYFVMSNATRPGPYSASANPGGMKRFPRPEERNVLCDIGYSVNSTFGTAANLNNYDYGSSCPGIQVAGIADGINGTGFYSFSTSGTTPVTINGGSAGSLLTNDFGAASFKCLEVVSGSGSVSVSTGGPTTVVTFTPATGASGIQLLRYIPVSAAGKEGNITYVYVYVGDPLCSPSSCDLVQNGGFESTDPSYLAYVAGAIHCWIPLNADPDLYGRMPTTFFPLPCGLCAPAADVHFPGTSATHPNDHFIAFQGMWSPFIHGMESLQSQLATPLTSGNTYQVSFWSRVANNPPYCTFPSHIELLVSPSTTMFAPVPDFYSPMPSGLTSLASFEVTGSLTDNDWHYFSKTITYSGPDAHLLVVAHNTYLNPTTGPYNTCSYEFLLLDDVSIKPATAIATLTLPDTICAGSGIIDLRTRVSIPGGVFSWRTSTMSTVTTSHDSMFNPATAYTASAISGDTGACIIGYSYTDVNGCYQSIYKEIHLVNASTAAITGNLNICQDVPATLTNAVAGGSWSSNTIAVATIGATSGSLTGHVSGTATISYRLPNGCYTTAIATVNPFPITGAGTVNIATTITLGYPTSGGTWSSSSPAIATIGASTGVVTGVAIGTSMVTYSFSATCYATAIVTVIPAVGVPQFTGHESVFSLVPNPNRGVFFISGTAPGLLNGSLVTFEMIDISGKVLLTGQIPVENSGIRKEVTIGDNVKTGIYYVKIKADGFSQVLRFTLNR